MKTFMIAVRIARQEFPDSSPVVRRNRVIELLTWYRAASTSNV